MRLALLTIFRPSWTEALGESGDASWNCGLELCSRVYFWVDFASVFCNYLCSPTVRSYLRRERLMMIVGIGILGFLGYFVRSCFHSGLPLS